MRLRSAELKVRSVEGVGSSGGINYLSPHTPHTPPAPLPLQPLLWLAAILIHFID